MFFVYDIVSMWNVYKNGWGFSAFMAGMACAIRPIRQCHVALFVKTIKKNEKS